MLQGNIGFTYLGVYYYILPSLLAIGTQILSKLIASIYGLLILKLYSWTCYLLYPAMSTAPTTSKANIGVFTNPTHDLWVADTEPSLDTVKNCEGLKEGEVTIGVRSTGICGLANPLLRYGSFLS